MRIAILLAALAGGCGTSTSAHTPPSTLAADGQRFDPPVEKSEIPPGGWMCDMGTVHYASRERREGECPVCGMKLVQKPQDAR